jgi:hypothetical protein
VAAAGARERESDGEMEQMGEDKNIQGIFANIYHRGATWHATSASDTCVARLGPPMKQLTEFRGPDV